MGKLCKKLVVYLDQNFISEMAKAPTNTRVNPQFTAVYELLHRGFIEEKILVPRSFFHEIETSLASELREQIQTYQGYLGQTSLRDRLSVQQVQLDRAIQAFRGEEPEPIDHSIAFYEDPDLPLRMLDIRPNVNWDILDIRGDRERTWKALEETRQRVLQSGCSYQDQVQLEIADHATHLLAEHLWILPRLGDQQQLQAFTGSKHFAAVLSINIFSRMWSKLLVDPDRQIKPGDHTDIELISAYLPYVHVLATDRFMATLVRTLNLDTEHNTRIFASSKSDLVDFETFLVDFLAQAQPANWPDLSIFVLSNERIKKDSVHFFRKLAAHVESCRRTRMGLVEVFGFNDGNMSRYTDPPSGTVWPFYGIQEVREVMLPPGSTREAVLDICRATSRARKFILIETDGLQPGFLHEVLAAAAACRPNACGFMIHDAGEQPPRLQSGYPSLG